MEAVAVEKLVEKAHFPSEVAVAIVEAMDTTIQAGDFVTVPVLDARFAAFDAKMEGRFSGLEKSIDSAKIWAISLYAALVIGLAVDHHWLVDRQDGAIERVEARSDQRFQRVEDHFKQIDVHFQQVDVHFKQVDAHFQQVDAHFQQVDDRLRQMDIELKEIRALLTPPRRRHSR